MKKFKFVVFLLPILFLFGCEKKSEGSQSIDINFKLNYNGAPLVFLTDLSYPDGRTLAFNRISFYVSGVTLSKGQSNTTSKDVKEFNFNNSSSSLAGALIGETVKFNGFREGEYSLIKLCIGVDKINNSKSPPDFPSNHPLSNQSEFWAGWKSYIFFRAEGFLDSNRDGSKDLGFALHTGSDETYRCIELPINLSLFENEPNTINLSMDVRKIFGSSVIYEIDKNPQLHSLSQLPQAIELANNIKGSISVE